MHWSSSLIVHGRHRLVVGPRRRRGRTTKLLGRQGITAQQAWSVVEFRVWHLLMGRNLTSHRGRGIGKCTQQDKGNNGRKVQTKERRDNSAKEVQVRIRNGIDGLQSSDTLSLREPTQQDSRRNNQVVLCVAREKKADMTK